MRDIVGSTPLDINIDNNTIDYFIKKFTGNQKSIRINLLK